MPSIRLVLLGPTACTGPDGEELAGVVRSRKRLALLAYLAVARPIGFHRRDTLVGLLWSESGQKRARGALRQAARHLRRELGETLASRGTEELGLDRDGFWCDAVACRDALESGRLEEGLELYEQDLLSGFYLSKAPGFEEWLETERRSLRRLAAEAAWELAEAAEGDQAARWARRAAGFTPYDEAAIRHLMSFLDQRGEAIGALREFERFRRRVHEEFGSPPGPETRALAGVIRAGTRVRVAASPTAREAPTGGEDQVGRTSERSSERARRGSALPRPVTPERQASESGVRDGGPTPARASSRRGPAAAFLAVSVAVILVITLWGSSRARLELSGFERVTDYDGSELMPDVSPSGDRIVFAAGQHGLLKIHMRRRSGGRAISLSGDLEGTHSHPVWSPDGEEVAFVAAMPDRTSAVYVVAAAGGSARRMVHGAAGQPIDGLAWSPDRSLVYSQNGEIRILDDSTRVTRKLTEAAMAHSFAWSPAGDRIAYVVNNSGYPFGTNEAPSSIWVVSVDSGRKVEITDGRWTDQSPAWSPDGRYLLFVSDRETVPQIYALELTSESRQVGEPRLVSTPAPPLSFSVSSDGTLAYSVRGDWGIGIGVAPLPSGEDPTPLTGARVLELPRLTVETIALSPDGEWIAFDAKRDGNQDIYVMRVDGDEPLRVTDSPADDFGPSWSPDSEQIVFYSYRDQNRDLYAVDREGVRERRLTATEGLEAFPHWSPIEDAIVFQLNTHEGTVGHTSIHLITREAGEWGSSERLVEPQAELPRWSPDGGWIAFRRSPAEIWVRNVVSGLESRLVESAPGGGPVIWSSDGAAVYFAATLNDELGIWRVSRDGGDPRLIAFDPSRRRGPFWFDGDEARLYFTSPEVLQADVWVADLEMGR